MPLHKRTRTDDPNAANLERYGDMHSPAKASNVASMCATQPADHLFHVQGASS